jgi:DNA-binding NtrC family response regulator
LPERQKMDLFSKLKKMRILLIDDDEWIRDSLSLYFEGEGCHLLALETTEEGIEALKGQNYDIIMVDYRLPGMDGLEFLKRIQKTQSHAMKVLITAYRSDEVVSEAFKMGIQDFIEKPFTTKTIEESLSWVIAKSESKDQDSVKCS